MINEFMSIFRGNMRSLGSWDPQTKESRTLHRAITEVDVKAHLDGRWGAGLVPILDDGTCYWGALDIDNHKTKKVLDIEAASAALARNNIPGVPCYSKSKGIHIYFFFPEGASASTVRSLLLMFMKKLDIEGSDLVFPRQGELRKNEDGSQAFGNWINLPYFGEEQPDGSDRRAYFAGKLRTWREFVDYVKIVGISRDRLRELAASDYSEMPPCLERLLTDGVGEGNRNQVVYQIAIYAKRKDEETAFETANEIIEKTSMNLPFRERSVTVKSALKGKYGYKCMDEPFRSLCQKHECAKRKFGIGDRDYHKLVQIDSMPEFASIVRFKNTEPVLWGMELMIGPDKARHVIHVKTEELLDFRFIRARMMEKTNRMVPKLADNDWVAILDRLMQNTGEAEAPQDASALGQLQTALDEFLRRVDNEALNTNDLTPLLRGIPVLAVGDKIGLGTGKFALFRGSDFTTFMQQKRMLTNVPSRDIWLTMIPQLGVQKVVTEIQSITMELWAYPQDRIKKHEIPVRKFESEF